MQPNKGFIDTVVKREAMRIHDVSLKAIQNLDEYRISGEACVSCPKPLFEMDSRMGIKKGSVNYAQMKSEDIYASCANCPCKAYKK